MKRAVTILLVSALVMAFLPAGNALAVPVAPTPLAPANQGSAQIPFTIAWSSVSDPNGIVAYNWQVSPSSSFSVVILQNSTNGATQDLVSGLADGTYFWRVQAVNGAFQQGAWSTPRSFTVNGAQPGTPGTPTLLPLPSYNTFHPLEFFPVNWTAASGAASYVLEASTSSSFPVATKIRFDNIPGTTGGFDIDASLQGNYFARVFAVGADGVVGRPSNLITFSVSYNNPIGPAPALVSPATGATQTLPITLTWAHVPYPQDLGYQLQISNSSSFSSIEYDAPQLSGPSREVLSLTAGTKFWRVRSFQGDTSPTTAAATAWSATRSFTVPAGPSVPVSVVLAQNPLYGGQTTLVQLQVTPAVPTGGVTIALQSSNPAALPVPASVTIPGNTAWTQFDLNQFGLKAGQVTTPTQVTLTSTLNGQRASGTFTVLPPALQSLSSSHLTGGSMTGSIVMLNGQAPPGGAIVQLASNSPAMTPPGTVTVPAGVESASVSIPTKAVSATTTVTLTGTYNGQSVSAQFVLNPQVPPDSILLDKTTAVNTEGASGLVSIANPAPVDGVTLLLSSSNPAVASVPAEVMISYTGTRGGFNVSTSTVSSPTDVVITATGAGLTKSVTLTVSPSAPTPGPALSTFTVNPTSVVGGTSARGTVTLGTTAPAGGATVHLTSNQPGAASVPASVTIPGGSAGASFTITTSPSAGTTVQLSASLDQVSNFLFASLGVTPPPAQAGLSTVSLSPTSVTGGATSKGTVSLTGAAPSGGAKIALSSSSATASLPASVTVPSGAKSATFTVTTSTVTAQTSATITTSYGGVSRTASLTITRAGTTGPAAPTLLAPANQATVRQPVAFDWSDVANAATYTIQIDDSSTFAAPFVVNVTVSASTYTATGLPQRVWWRVRAIDASGTAGPWSPTRRLDLR
ncbi:MAG: hypothetical protein ABI862_02525 [Ilumatobacteraceae bacterium]